MARLGAGAFVVVAALLACGGRSDPPEDSAGSGAAAASGSSGVQLAGGSSAGGSAGTSPVTSAGTGGTVSLPAAGSAAAGSAAAGAAGTPADVPDSATAACIEYVRGYCERQQRCGGLGPGVDPERGVRLCIFGIAQDCPDYFFSDGSVRTVEGTFACADEWRDFTCEAEAPGTVPACALPGTRETDEPCVFGSQCASQICSVQGGEMCGVCRARVGAGEPCDGAVTFCERSFACSGTPMTCQPLEQPPLDPPAVEPIPQLGEECELSGVACGGAAVADCRADPDDGVYRCVPWPVLGEDCSDPSVKTCLLGNSYCDISGTCLALPGAGAPCGVDGFTGQPSWCAAEHRCNFAYDPPECEGLPSAGSVCEGLCTDGFECLCVDAMCTTRRCQIPRLLGESCAGVNDLCLPDATRCENGVCVAVETQSLFEQRCM